MNPRPAGIESAEELAALQASAFAASGERGWTRAEFAALLTAPDTLALLLPGAGFVLARASGGEAEILTLAVMPAFWRHGHGAALLATAVKGLAARGVRRMVLEVAADNAAALALYTRRGFAPVGRRPAYYARRDAPAADALLLARDLPGGDSPARSGGV